MGLSAKTIVLGAVLAMAAVILLPRAALADDLEAPSVEEAKIPSGGLGGTARLRGFDVTFDFHSNDNTMGYSWQCKGLDFPAGNWPKNCSVMFHGPAITERFGMFGGEKLVCSPGCVLKDGYLTDILIFSNGRLLSAVIPPGGCWQTAPDGSLGPNPDCVATFSAAPGKTFGFGSVADGNWFGHTWRCRTGVQFPAKPLPEGCEIFPRWPGMPQGPRGRDDQLSCSPFCFFQSQKR